MKLLGEDAAARYLSHKGFRILERNYRLRMGELDIVAMDGDVLVFVEVKARKKATVVEPELAVDYRKQVQLRRVAAAYIAFAHPRYQACRFDVVSVIAGPGPAMIRHLPNAF